MSADVTLHRGRVEDLDPAVLYAVLRLRVDVFVVEQQCPYPELDGRDLEPDARVHWATQSSDPTTVLATLRTLRDPAGDVRIGRVATASAARGSGLAARLLAAALDTVPAGTDVVLAAQSPLAGWYARFGFVVDGAEFVEDDIPHVPMRRRAATDLAAARAGAVEDLRRSRAELAALVAATADANTDDEHDPEGATIAWERQQLVAAVDRARARIDELDAAAARRHDGSYGVCAGCGRPIGAERLAARPSATRCVACARGSRPC